MDSESSKPTNVGSNDQLGLSPERAAFEAWAARRWGREAHRHTSNTCAEWDAWQAARVDLVAALQWYADGLHFDKASPDAWDTVSGEPQNWWCDEAGTATVEDGSIAAMTLRGELTALVNEVRDALSGEQHACSIAVWITKMDAIADDADDKGVAGWLDEAEQRVKRRGVKAPCGECHLQPGERCDVCGASSGA